MASVKEADLDKGIAGQRTTGLILDATEEQHRCIWDPLHIEKPERTTSVRKRLEELKDSVLDRCQLIEVGIAQLNLLESPRNVLFQGRPATESELRLVHTEELVETVKNTCNQDAGDNHVNHKALSEKFNAIYITEFSHEVAKVAVGSTIELVDAVQKGRLSNGLAVIRPPGHHASCAESNGFCLYNNVAIAAKHLLENCGIERILIIDWDVHHGQGTQRIFYEDNRVLYFSIHTYEEGRQWPNLKESNFDHVGSGKGAGYNINVPLNKLGLEDVDYMAIFHQILLPVAYQFNPEAVLISAGYDAAIGCPEGHMRITPAMFGHMTHALTNLAGGKVSVILEGGYCLESLAEGVLCTLEALLGYPCCPLPSLGLPEPSVVSSILNVISVLRTYWSCLGFQEKPRRSQRYAKNITLPNHVPHVVFEGPSDPPDNQAYGCTPFYTCAETVELRHEIKALQEQYDCFRKQLNRLKHRTCFVYDEVMMHHKEGMDDWTPEIPDRILSIFNHLTDAGVLSHCIRLPPRDVLLEELVLVHSEEYSEVLNMGRSEFYKITTDRSGLGGRPRWRWDCVTSIGSQPAVACAAGSLLNIVDAVLSGDALNGYAIIRPPGHHAHFDRPAGFCFANNVAIAARHAVTAHGLERVLIVDWDVHHGDGSQETFYDDPKILYLSLHRGGDFYPSGPGTEADKTGTGAGVGFNVNIPWQQKGMTDSDYITAFLQVVMPVAYEFAPELVLVSCGYDAALGDQLGGCKVTRTGYSTMTRMLMSLAGGKVVLALEGGYNLRMLADCSEGVVKALLGSSAEPMFGSFAPSENAIRDIKIALDAQTLPKRLWQCLQYRVTLHNPVKTDEPGLNDLDSLLGEMKIQAN